MGGGLRRKLGAILWPLARRSDPVFAASAAARAVRIGSKRSAAIHSANCSGSRLTRSESRRTCATNKPVSTLCVITANRSQAALAPQRPHGITPAAKSFFSTSCSASTVPAFSRCHSGSRTRSHPQSLVATAKYLAWLPSANSSPYRLRMQIAMCRNGPARFRPLFFLRPVVLHIGTVALTADIRPVGLS